MLSGVLDDCRAGRKPHRVAPRRGGHRQDRASGGGGGRRRRLPGGAGAGRGAGVLRADVGPVRPDPRVLGRLDQLPAPQRDAVRGALGQDTVPPPSDRFTLGVALLGLLSAAAERRPVMVAIDDLAALGITVDQAASATRFETAAELTLRRGGGAHAAGAAGRWLPARLVGGSSGRRSDRRPQRCPAGAEPHGRRTDAGDTLIRARSGSPSAASGAGGQGGEVGALVACLLVTTGVLGLAAATRSGEGKAVRAIAG